MELFAAIRDDRRREDLSIHKLAERHHVHRRTVRQALASAIPPPRKVVVRSSRVLEPLKPAIDGHAVCRSECSAQAAPHRSAVLARLVDEQDAVNLSYSTVRDYVAKRRPEIWAEANRSADQAFVPQVHQLGAEGEVNFADLWVLLRG